MPNKMSVYFSKKTIDGQIPENIINDVRNYFTMFKVTTLPDGTILIKVPKEEEKIINNFYDDVLNLLRDIKKENSVLASKLARQYGFKQPK